MKCNLILPLPALQVLIKMTYNKRGQTIVLVLRKVVAQTQLDKQGIILWQVFLQEMPSMPRALLTCFEAIFQVRKGFYTF
jgi:hypothetical protein